MSRHTISHADELYAGAAQAGGINSAARGVKIALVHQQVITNPIAGDIDGLVTAAGSGATAAAGDVAIDGAFLSDGVGVIDGPRNIAIKSSNAGDTTQVITITGTDIVGNAQVEEITANGTTEVVGAKAFATVTEISNSVVFVGNLTVGTTATLASIELGLDTQMLNAYDAMLALTGAGAADGGSYTVADVTNPPTATTGDARGTYNPGNAPDGSADFILYYVPNLTKDAYGENYAG